MLTSQEIPFHHQEEPGDHRLFVAEPHVTRALEELQRYEQENRGPRLPRTLPPAAPGVLPAVAAWVGVLVLFAWLQWNSAFELDWLAAGTARASAIRAGELARAATALTLHADVPHLLSNCVFGGLFGLLLFHSTGGGIGLLALLVSGFLGNLANAWFHAGEHRSIGASTAVFAAIGCLAGSEVRARHLLREARTRRLAPAVGALALLAYLGVEEANPGRDIDVLAHAFGLGAGFLTGLVLGSLERRAVERRGLQAACAASAALGIVSAWGVALRA